MTTLWGSNIKRLREARGINASAFAASVGVSAATVSDWESGKIKKAEAANLLRAARVLGVGLEDLIEREIVVEANEPPARYGRPTLHLSPAAVRIDMSADWLLGEDGAWHHTDHVYVPMSGSVLYPTSDPKAYALLVANDTMRPRFKPGEAIVIEPSQLADVGDEVAVKLADGRIIVRVFDWLRNGLVQLSSVNDDGRPLTVRVESVEFMHRVAGAMQLQISAPTPPRASPA